MWRGDVNGMREIVESDFFIRNRIDKRVNWLGIWRLRLITRNFHTKLKNNLKKSFSNEIKVKVKAFQYEWETYNFGQYYDIEIDNIGTINIWFGYDYSPEVNKECDKNNNNFYIALTSKTIDFSNYAKKIDRFRRESYSSKKSLTKEPWFYKKITKKIITPGKLFREIKKSIEFVESHNG